MADKVAKSEVQVAKEAAKFARVFQELDPCSAMRKFEEDHSAARRALASFASGPAEEFNRMLAPWRADNVFHVQPMDYAELPLDPPISLHLPRKSSTKKKPSPAKPRRRRPVADAVERALRLEDLAKSPGNCSFKEIAAKIVSHMPRPVNTPADMDALTKSVSRYYKKKSRR